VDVRLALIAGAQGQVFTTAQARDCGYATADIARVVRGGEWIRLRRGAFVAAGRWKAADERGRHVLLSQAVMLQLGDAVALSHQSAACRHGLDVYDTDLSKVHVTRLDAGSGRIEAGVVHHTGAIDPGECIRIDGALVMPADRAVVETMLVTSVDGAVVVGDSALFRRAATWEQLDVRSRSMPDWQGSRRMRLAVSFADAGGQSPGESLSRLLFWRGGLPAPTLQFPVELRDGSTVFTDFGWPAVPAVGEFDGKVKYGRLVRPGETPGDVVFREKRREEMVLDVGLPMRRLVWADIFEPRPTLERFARLLGVRPLYVV